MKSNQMDSKPEEHVMKTNIGKDINLNRCNAYSAAAHLYSAISVENGPVYSKNTEGTTEPAVPDDMKGGILVFPQGVNAVLYDIKKILRKHETAGWTIGRFFKGRKPCKNGKAYSEDSLSIEITGVSYDALIEIAEELCRAFDQKSVLIKFYSDRNKLIVESVSLGS